ncbi:MAG: YbaK/EbsC family protein [Syntrophomonadaceae bacterium]|jgi:prolyl-tRNA editing enzyme YbaK/EbsC (Cys-tRNA(Pro) deacylase)
MNNELSKSAQKIQAVLNEYGLELKVVEFEESTRTSSEAAAAIGCELGQIAKSLIFKGKNTEKPILVIASGDNRVDEKKIRALAGEKIGKADAAFVLKHTGYAIGGVPPVGHATPITPFIDQDLLRFEEIWSAAGTPHAVFKLTPDQLINITGGTLADVKVD